MKEINWTPQEIENNDKKELLFESKLKKEKMKSEERRRKHEIKLVKSENRDFNNRKKKLTTTKIFMYYILINCSIIEVYSMTAMIMMKDLSALYSLIGAVVGESLSYAIYCAKSFNDSKEEAKSKLERDKFEAGTVLSENEMSAIKNLIADEYPTEPLCPDTVCPSEPTSDTSQEILDVSDLN